MSTKAPESLLRLIMMRGTSLNSVNSGHRGHAYLNLRYLQGSSWHILRFVLVTNRSCRCTWLP